MEEWQKTSFDWSWLILQVRFATVCSWELIFLHSLCVCCCFVCYIWRLLAPSGTRPIRRFLWGRGRVLWVPTSTCTWVASAWKYGRVVGLRFVSPPIIFREIKLLNKDHSVNVWWKSELPVSFVFKYSIKFFTLWGFSPIFCRLPGTCLICLLSRCVHGGVVQIRIVICCVHWSACRSVFQCRYSDLKIVKSFRVLVWFSYFFCWILDVFVTVVHVFCICHITFSVDNMLNSPPLWPTTDQYLDAGRWPHCG